jgi:hypothetical protein
MTARQSESIEASKSNSHSHFRPEPIVASKGRHATHGENFRGILHVSSCLWLDWRPCVASSGEAAITPRTVSQQQCILRRSIFIATISVERVDIETVHIRRTNVKSYLCTCAHQPGSIGITGAK